MGVLWERWGEGCFVRFLRFLRFARVGVGWGVGWGGMRGIGGGLERYRWREWRGWMGGGWRGIGGESGEDGWMVSVRISRVCITLNR